MAAGLGKEVPGPLPGLAEDRGFRASGMTLGRDSPREAASPEAEVVRRPSGTVVEGREHAAEAADESEIMETVHLQANGNKSDRR